MVLVCWAEAARKGAEDWTYTKVLSRLIIPMIKTGSDISMGLPVEMQSCLHPWIEKA